MAKKQKQHTKLETELLDTLSQVACNADEDCPSEYRTEHFRESLKDAFKLLKREGRC
jgi:hypothetical protein